MNHFSVLMQFLRDRVQFLEEIRTSKRLEKKISSLLICSCLFFALYGAIMGSYSGWLQMLASAAKLPALYLLTLLICLPSLFFFFEEKPNVRASQEKTLQTFSKV